MSLIDYSRLLSTIDNFRNKNIICIGDLMLDRYVYGSVERISPEAPIPVLSNIHEESMLGAAGNVARNIASLGAKVEFYAATGDDKAGIRVKELLAKEEKITSYIYTHKGDTTTKTRYISGSQQLLRVDVDGRFSGLVSMPKSYDGVDAIVISDYCKGMMHDIYADKVITPAFEQRVPVIVDSKSPGFLEFKGATVITPNLGELANSIDWFQQYGTDENVIDAARELILKAKVENVLVTRASKGMTLQTQQNDTFHIPAKAKEVYDVVGAGDTVAAVLALGIACGLSVFEASFLANLAGGIVVGKRGTAIVFPIELKAAVLSLMAEAPLIPQQKSV